MRKKIRFLILLSSMLLLTSCDFEAVSNAAKFKALKQDEILCVYDGSENQYYNFCVSQTVELFYSKTIYRSYQAISSASEPMAAVDYYYNEDTALYYYLAALAQESITAKYGDLVETYTEVYYYTVNGTGGGTYYSEATVTETYTFTLDVENNIFYDDVEVEIANPIYFNSFPAPAKEALNLMLDTHQKEVHFISAYDKTTRNMSAINYASYISVI